MCWITADFWETDISLPFSSTPHQSATATSSTGTDRQQVEFAWKAQFSNHSEKKRERKKKLEKWFSFWWPPTSILRQNNESTSTHLQCLVREFAVSLPIIDTRRRTPAIMESLRWHQTRKWMISPCFSFFRRSEPL